MGDFCKTKFNGIEFDDHTIPIEYLENLITLRNTIIEQAKHLFFIEHPNQKYLPRGFKKRLNLKLARISEGSAIAELMTNLDHFEAPNFSPTQLLTKSGQDVFDTLKSLKQPPNGFVTQLSRDAMSHLKKFGSCLKTNQTIEIYLPNDQTPQLSYTQKDRLVFLDRYAPESKQDQTSLIGKIGAVNKKKRTFTLTTTSNEERSFKWDDKLKEDVLRAFGDFEKGQFVKIKLVATSKGKQKLIIDEVDRLSPLDFELQFERIKNLKNGWFDGNGYSYDKDILDSFLADVDQYYPETIENPYIFPTIEGNILFEWSFKRDEVSLEINLKDRSTLWCSINLSNDKETIKEINLITRDDWNTLINMLRELSVNND
jgi:hypothetical protein